MNVEVNIMDFAGKSTTSFQTMLRYKPIFDLSNINQRIPQTELENTGRESLGIINLNNLDLGRESLGITQIELNSFNEVPEITVTDLSDFKNGTPGIFNTAFLSSPKKSCGSISSFNSISPSFHSSSLDSNIPSRISSYSDCVSDILNEVFIDSSTFVKRLHLQGRLSMSSLYFSSEKISQVHQRIKSLPSTLGHLHTNTEDTEKTKSHSLTSKSNEEFADSVFIEAYHLAERIENGSILELEEDENDMLESFHPPDFVASQNEDICEETKNDISVDNFSLPLLVSFKTNQQPEDDKSKKLDSDNQLCEKRKSEAQNLISNAEILSDSKKTINDSSQDYCGVLDLSMKSKSEPNINEESRESDCPLDLSLKSKSSNSKKDFSSSKILGQKLNVKSNCSTSSNEKSFKLRKSEDSTKKGPLRATVSFEDITKRKSFTKPEKTPRRIETQSTNKMKKTSTPVNEIMLKPIAQSTPEPSDVKSYLTKPTTSSNNNSNILKKKLNYSDTNLKDVKTQNVNSKISCFVRRKSVSDLKKNQRNKAPLNRSYSAGEKSEIAKTVAKNRESLNKNKSATSIKPNFLSKSANTSTLNRNKPSFGSSIKTTPK